MALARPRGGLGHIRPKLPSSIAPPCPSWHTRTVRASAQWPCRARALALGALGKGPGSVAHLRAPDGAPAMTHERKSMAAKGKGKLATSPTRKSPRLAGLPPSLPPTSPKLVLRPKKLLVLAIAADAVRIHSKAPETHQAPIVEPPKDVKGKRTTRISNEVIDLVSDEEKEVAEEKKDPEPKDEEEEEDPEEAAEEKKDPEPEDEEEEEDPEEASASLTLPLPPRGPSGAYDDPHSWDYDGDLDQWGTDVFGGEPAAAQALDSAEGLEGSCSPSSTSTK
ncbi:hypothetical protein PIB30_068676 [Stylosanthes scabra]|uniref:Uncharacterized protein n=1 Tax=Stylosanthes scabra TaxID=79078 RepID=A0ABU6VLF9_9FABA|nr:hypothetical protein [Stylosanthes scabra]